MLVIFSLPVTNTTMFDEKSNFPQNMPSQNDPEKSTESKNFDIYDNGYEYIFTIDARVKIPYKELNEGIPFENKSLFPFPQEVLYALLESMTTDMQEFRFLRLVINESYESRSMNNQSLVAISRWFSIALQAHLNQFPGAKAAHLSDEVGIGKSIDGEGHVQEYQFLGDLGKNYKDKYYEVTYRLYDIIFMHIEGSGYFKITPKIEQTTTEKGDRLLVKLDWIPLHKNYGQLDDLRAKVLDLE